MSAVTAKHIETGGKSRESRKFEAFPSPWTVHAPCLDESLVVNDAGGGFLAGFAHLGENSCKRALFSMYLNLIFIL